jgi:hypothetical protein
VATKETWSKLKYFKPNGLDKWGDANAISDRLLFALDDFRHFLGVPVYVTCGVETGGHSGNSFHYPENGACAVDVIVPEYLGTPFDLVLDATRFGFTGIGYYPHWHWNGLIGNGLHLDMRPLKWDKDETLNYQHSRWMGIKQKVGGAEKQVYIPLTYENILKYGGIYEVGSNSLN